AFDYLIGSSDRHPGNWLIAQDGKIVLIDNAIAFGETFGPQNFLLMFAFQDNLPVPKEIASWDWDSIKDQVKERLGNEDTVNALKGRFDDLVKAAKEGRTFDTIDMVNGKFGTFDERLKWKEKERREFAQRRL